jgi:nucleoside-diphosphate-sugar epimerase
MQIVLTGANSFLGRHVAAHLAGQGHYVLGTYRSEGSVVAALRAAANLGHLSLYALDIADPSAFSALPARIDAVVHIAGISTAPGISLDEMLACNVTGARNVLRYALGAGAAKLVYASTLSVHGRIAGSEVTEDTPVDQPDVYGASKYMAERMFAERAGELPVAAIRLPGILGEGAHRAWIPTLVEKIADDRPFTIFNPDSPFNNAAHVDDLARLVESMLAGDWSGFHAFPVGAAGMTTVRGVVEALYATAGKPPRIDVGPARQPGFTISSDYANRVFGYRAQEIGDMVRRYAKEYFAGVEDAGRQRSDRSAHA